MKFSITFKDPDGVCNSLDEEAKSSAAQVEGLDADERETLEESRREALGEAAKPWVGWGEYITIDFDSEAKTATVRKWK